MPPAVPLPSSLPPPEDDEGAPPWPARRDDPDDVLPLPPLEGDDELPEGPEPGLPPDTHDPGLDDAVADDLPVGTSIDALDAPPLDDDDALGTNGEGDDALGDAPPPLTDEGEGFEDESDGGLPDDDHARPLEDDGGEGLGHVSDGLEVDPLPDLDPDDESGPLGEPHVLPARRPVASRPAPLAWLASGPYPLPFATQALAALDDGALAVAGEGLALFGGSPPAPRGVFHPFDEGAPALTLCLDPWRSGALLLVDRRLDVYAFDPSRALLSPRPPLPGPPLTGPNAPTLWRLEGPRLVAWHPSGLTLSLDADGRWTRFFHVPFVAFAADGARACVGLAESIEGHPRLHLSDDGGITWGAHDVPPGLSAAPAGPTSPWLLGRYAGLVLLGRPGRGLWASPERGVWRALPGGENAFALAPPGADPFALFTTGGRGAQGVQIARVDGAGDTDGGPRVGLPEVFAGPDVRLAWDAASARLWLARGAALMALTPPPS